MLKVNLSRIDLTKLPEYLKLKEREDIIELDLSFNKIKKLDNLPPNLQVLDLRYNKITKIDNLPSNLQKLYLFNNKITKIENLPPNLQVLNLSQNKITKIENLPPNLQVLDLRYNKITKIDNLPSNLQKLDLYNNKITKIENLPPNLQVLNLNNNKIKKIENLTPNLQELDLGINKITKIENLPSNLQKLYLSNNQITEIPLELLELRQLNKLSYSNNPIENLLHPLIDRWLDRLNDKLNKNNQVYSDGQNIHNSNIQKSFRNSLQSVIKDELNNSLETCLDYFMKSEVVAEEVKQEIMDYCDDKMEHSVYLITFKELFHYVLNRILNHKETDELLVILNEEMKETICKCFTGRMTRLLNVLNGYYEDVQIQIGSNEQINNLIIVLMKKYSGEELRDKFTEEMKEREYDVETIDHWKQFLE